MLNFYKLKSLIKEHKWSVSSFCDFFGKGSGWIADMERGRGLPDENMLKAFADKLDTTVDYLTDKTDIKEQKNKPAAKSDELGPKGKAIWERLKKIREFDEDAYEIAVAQLDVTLSHLEKKHK